jgi:hypothetical protein
MSEPGGVVVQTEGGDPEPVNPQRRDGGCAVALEPVYLKRSVV